MQNALDEERRQLILDKINAGIENPLQFKNDFHANSVFGTLTPVGGILGISGFAFAAYVFVCILYCFIICNTQHTLSEKRCLVGAIHCTYYPYPCT